MPDFVAALLRIVTSPFRSNLGREVEMLEPSGPARTGMNPTAT